MIDTFNKTAIIGHHKDISRKLDPTFNLVEIECLLHYLAKNQVLVQLLANWSDSSNIAHLA